MATRDRTLELLAIRQNSWCGYSRQNSVGRKIGAIHSKVDELQDDIAQVIKLYFKIQLYICIVH